jgi:hypothetical protein
MPKLRSSRSWTPTWNVQKVINLVRSHNTNSLIVWTYSGWLEPLLSEIAANRKAVVCPIIDVLSDETFEYITGKFD